MAYFSPAGSGNGSLSPSPEDFAQVLKSRRGSLGLTQGQLAEAALISKRTVINYEQGKHYPANAQTARRLARALSMKVEDLLPNFADLYPEAQEPMQIQSPDLARVVSEMQVLFAGASLSDADKEAAIHALMEAYLDQAHGA